MRFADFYGIPEDVAKKMIRNGHVSCSVARHFEIYDAYKKFVACCGLGKTKDDMYSDVADQMKVSVSTVRQVVYSMDKI